MILKRSERRAVRRLIAEGGNPPGAGQEPFATAWPLRFATVAEPWSAATPNLLTCEPCRPDGTALENTPPVSLYLSLPPLQAGDAPREYTVGDVVGYMPFYEADADGRALHRGLLIAAGSAEAADGPSASLTCDKHIRACEDGRHDVCVSRDWRPRVLHVVLAHLKQDGDWDVTEHAAWKWNGGAAEIASKTITHTGGNVGYAVSLDDDGGIVIDFEAATTWPVDGGEPVPMDVKVWITASRPIGEEPDIDGCEEEEASDDCLDCEDGANGPGGLAVSGTLAYTEAINDDWNSLELTEGADSETFDFIGDCQWQGAIDPGLFGVSTDASLGCVTDKWTFIVLHEGPVTTVEGNQYNLYMKVDQTVAVTYDEGRPVFTSAVFDLYEDAYDEINGQAPGYPRIVGSITLTGALP